MCSIGKKNLIVFITFIYYLHNLESIDARPEQLRLKENITQNPSSSERIVTRRILAKPNSRRGANPQKYEKSSNNQAIVFPDDSDEDSLKITPMKPYERPPCAKGSTICEKIDGYPSDLIERIFQKPNPLENLFGIDDGPDEITNRLGDDEEFSLCESEDKIMFPTFGRTKNDEWKYIVNQEGSAKYVQGVRVETCKNNGQQCSPSSNEPLEYTFYCKQKHIYRKLITITDEGQPTTDFFELPSACCCVYKKKPLDRLSFK